MTLGEKIVYLRKRESISQKQLAGSLGVSRQSISKWEMDQATPRLDKIYQLCDLFHIGIDHLLCDELLQDAPNDQILESNPLHSRYFGAGEYRGQAGITLTAEKAFRIGRFLGWFYAHSLSGCQETDYRPRIVIGKDTRRSCYMLEYALAAGISASGADSYMLHVTTAPSVSYVTRTEGFDCGVMISAACSSYEYNGISLINRYGEKADARTLFLLDAYLNHSMEYLKLNEPELPCASRDRIGAMIDHVSGRNRYMGYLISVAAHSFRGLRIGLDCANGSAWMIAPAIYEALGAKTYVIGAQPSGQNINRESGTAYLGHLQKLVKENHLDVGFAFDGDADRCIAVDERGEKIDGDKILYILACQLKRRGILDRNTVVTTTLAGLGLKRALEDADIHTILTPIGIHHVYDAMMENGYQLGGDTAGHLLMRRFATMGDGILTSLMLMEEMMERKTTLHKLAAPVHALPQCSSCLPLSDPVACCADQEILDYVAKWRRKGEGTMEYCHIAVYPSEDETEVCIAAEGSDGEFCHKCVEQIQDMICRSKYFDSDKKVPLQSEWNSQGVSAIQDFDL